MKLLSTLLISCILILAVSCEKKNATPSNESRLLGITLASGNAVIDTANKKVILKVPENTDLTKIVPHFDISAGATIYPPSDVATDYSAPVVYTITSADKSSTFIFTVSALKPVAKFTVYDCSVWSVTSTRVLQPGATIKIYASVNDVNTSKTFDVLSSDPAGMADFYGEKGKGYFITVNKDSKSNINNGYVLDGRYDTVEEVASSPIWPNAAVGGLKYKDVNGDGRVTADDKYNYDIIYVATYYTGVKPVDFYIAGAK